MSTGERCQRAAGVVIRMATLPMQMPPLHVISPRVDHEKTKSWDIESVCWHNGWFTHDKLGKSQQLQQAAMREAQKMIAEVAQAPEFIDEARSSAEQIISALYKGTGYSVSLEWPDQQGSETESVDSLPQQWTRGCVERDRRTLTPKRVQLL